MTDRTAPSSDARKRNAEAAQDPDAFTREWLRWQAQNRPHFTTHAHVFTQEDPMNAKDRHDELVALLSKISEESVTTSNVLADTLDLLRDRLPEPTGSGTCMTCGTELYAGDPLDCRKHEPAPDDDLPGEPVEPGDLRAGDVVAFTYDGERIEGPLVRRFGLLSVEMTDHSPIDVRSILGRWATGISDVRLLERAPREGEDRDEALARVIFGDAYGSHEGLRLAQLDVALMAREHIEAEQEDVVATLREEVEIQTARAERAEAERDALRERLDALRDDIVNGRLLSAAEAAFGGWLIARDDERAAKGEPS